MNRMSHLDFHHGQALLHVASRYQTLFEVICEAVQNSLDLKAQNIQVVADYKNRTVTISDDGEGTTLEKFGNALRQICQTTKSEDDLGQFGIGLIAPLGKCEKFTLTSTPKFNAMAYITWTFDTKSLSQQSRIAGVPFEKRPDLLYSRDPKAKNQVNWRSQIKLINFTKDRMLSKLDLNGLKEDLLEKFSVKMLKLNSQITITIIKEDGEEKSEKFKAEKYKGKHLTTVTLTDPDAGQTSFNLWISPKTAKGRKGKVHIGQRNNPFRMVFSQFSRTSVGSCLSKEVIETLTSGAFEGEILGEKIILDSDRKHFRKDDALLGFCSCIEDWFKTTGRQYMNEIKEQTQDERYQQLGLRSLKVIEAMLKLPEFALFREIIGTFKIGTIGTRHVRPEAKNLGLQEENSLSSQGGSSNRGEKTTTVNGGPREPQKEHPQHIPTSVIGPRGRQRTMVRSNSLGLQYSYDETEGSTYIWDFDNKTGVLRINLRHPIVEQFDKDDNGFMKFQEYVTIQALLLETVPADWKERFRAVINDQLPSLSFWMLQGDMLAGRKPGRKPKT